MGRQARRDVPRWRRQRYVPAGPAIALSGRRAERVAREMARAVALREEPEQPKQGVVAATGAYRYRHQLVPFWLLLLAVTAGETLHLTRELKLSVLAGIVGAAPALLLTRHLNPFEKRAGIAAGCLIALWLPLLAYLGAFGPAGAVLLLCWASFTVPWVAHYRIRVREPDEPEQTDAELWRETLGAKGRLEGSRLLPLEQVAGGTKYLIALRRGQHDTSDVFGMTRKIASLFGKPVTEVYPERFPDAREHELMLTKLDRNSLQEVRMWDGEGIDPATGLAVIGDFPDGTPAHFRFWSPRNGAEQSIIVGVKGSGKSYLLHLLLAAAVTSRVPVVPVVMDPQNGQSLPDWRGHVAYARGTEECFAYLKAFEAGMMARSDYLADLAWTDDDGYERPGMDFYDPHRSGLPLIFGVLDEAHLPLSHPKHGTEAQRIVGNLVKLNRKAGGHLALVSHTLLLTQLGDMTLRAMVIGGNVVALRTGETMSGGIIGLEADPRMLPRRFPDGAETHGLGYTVGPDDRPDSPMRVRLVPNPRKVAVETPAAEMDPVFGKAFRASLAGTAPLPVSLSPVAAVPPMEDDKPGRTAADAVLQVVKGETSRNDILAAVKRLATQEWGRPQPFAMRSVTMALEALTGSGQLVKTGHGMYAPAKASLTVVGAKS